MSNAPKVTLAVVALGTAIALAGCSLGGSDSKADTVAPEAAEEGGNASSGQSLKGTSATQREAFIYTALIEKLVKDVSHGKDRPKVIYILDGVVSDAADPRTTAGPQTPFSHDLKDGVSFLARLTNLPRLEFVASRDVVVVGAADGKRPGQVKDGGALVTLGDVIGSGNRVEVGNNIWMNGLAGYWQTHVLVHDRGEWRVTGTTGPMAIS
jgi:hypothetical protein